MQNWERTVLQLAALIIGPHMTLLVSALGAPLGVVEP